MKETDRVRASKERGALLISLGVSFNATATPTAWKEFVERLGFMVSEASRVQVAGWAASFVALPAENKRGALYLSGQVHLDHEKPDVAHWSLDLAVRPDSAPPAALVERSNLTGGLEGMLSKISEQWPGDRNVTVSVRASYGLLEQARSVLQLPLVRSVRARVNRKNLVVKPEFISISWKLPRALGLSDVTTASGGERDPVILSARGKHSCGVSPEMFETLDREIWKRLANLVHVTSAAQKSARRKRSGRQ